MDNRSIQKDKETVNELLGMALEVIDKYDQPMRPPVRPEVSASGWSGKPIFRSFAEQLLAIREAGTPGGKVDPRLYEVRAATGLSETVPADGGFLISPQYSQEIFRHAFDVGQIAKLCRSVTIGANANSLKINAIDETSRATTRWGGIVGYWLDEAAEKQSSKPKFKQMELTLAKPVVLCYATDELLQDAVLLDQTLRQGFIEEIAFRTDLSCFF